MREYKVGDRVRIARKVAGDHKHNYLWNPRMDSTIGKEGTVSCALTGIGTLGVQVEGEDYEWFYFPDSLEAQKPVPVTTYLLNGYDQHGYAVYEQTVDSIEAADKAVAANTLASVVVFKLCQTSPVAEYAVTTETIRKVTKL